MKLVEDVAPSGCQAAQGVEAIVLLWPADTRLRPDERLPYMRGGWMKPDSSTQPGQLLHRRKCAVVSISAPPDHHIRRLIHDVHGAS